jgi:signal transduction histidine kinase
MMGHVFLVYGSAFILMGGILALQAWSPIRVLARNALWALVAFAVVHGIAEWWRLMHVFVGLTPTRELTFELLLALSFVALGQFGVEVEISLHRWPRWARAGPALVGLAVVIAIALLFPRLPATSLDALVRYATAIPASLLACAALLHVGGTLPGPERVRQRRQLAIAAYTFAAFGVVAGLVAGDPPFFSAAILHADGFRQLTGVPVELLRATCAVIIAVALAEAFVIESARTQAAAERLREEFISVVAHDLRSPLQTIGLLASSLERMPPDRPQANQVAIDRIRERIKTLDRMIGDLMDASLIEANRLVLRPVRVDMAKLVGGVVERADALVSGHSVELVPSPGSAEVEGDPVRLEQVFTNLLSNAGKYGLPGTPIRVEVSTDAREVTVGVTNRGPGIPKDALPHLFERFYRTDASRRGPVPGTGIGLYLARGLVEAHGGRIWLEPGEDDRTTFRFLIPRAGPEVRDVR